MKYHEPGGRYYDITIAELYFDTPSERRGRRLRGGRPAGRTAADTGDDADTEES